MNNDNQVPSLLHSAFSVLGREMFARVTSHLSDGDGDEWCYDVMSRAEKLGLCRREEYVPDKAEHLAIEAEPGDLVWVWDHLPPGWRSGEQEWEPVSMDGQRLEPDPSKRQCLRAVKNHQTSTKLSLYVH